MGFTRVATLDQLPERGVLGVEADGEKIVLVVTDDGELYALRDRCSHADFPLSDGELMPDGKRLECKYHGAKFDVASGRAVALPAIRPVRVYDVRIEGDEILVELE